MLNTDQIQEFQKRGFTRLVGAFARESAAAMEDRVWIVMRERHGVVRDDPTTWAGKHGSGLQDVRDEPLFDAIGSPCTCGAIDDLLGAGTWRYPRHWGQLLVTFPDPTRTWNVPSSTWHTDFGFDPLPEHLPGLLVFSFLSPVPARSGGTHVVEGSHRLMRSFVARQPVRVREKMKRVRKAFLASDPWLCALTSDEGDPDRVRRFVQTEHTIDGVPVRVTELIGEPGDVVLAHPWLLHTSGPNCSRRVRIMCVQRVHAD